MVAFALETEDQRLRAMQKLERKSCDLIVVNGPAAMHAEDTQVEVLDAGARCWRRWPAEVDGGRGHFPRDPRAADGKG